MKVEFINPFVSAAFRVFENYGVKVTKGTLKIAAIPIEGKEVNTLIGVTGDVLGQVIYSVTAVSALKIASLMLMGMPVEHLDEMSKSAINELGNMITGNAATELGNNGYICDVTPPTLFMGKDVRISATDVHTLEIPVLTNLGEITIYVALREANRK